MRTRLTAIVPATNTPPTLDRCLEAIARAHDGPEQVIVATDPPHAGPAQARNSVVGPGCEDVLVFIDADVLVHRDAFIRIRERFDRDAGLAAVFGSYDDEPDARQLISRFRNLLHHHVHQRSGGPAGTFWAGLGAVRRTAFVRAGGFDGRRFDRPSVEDIDLGMRLVAQGERIELDTHLQGTHLKRWTLRNMIRTDFRQRGIPWTALMLLRGSSTTKLNLGWSHRASAVMSVLLLMAPLLVLLAPLLAAALAASALTAIVAINASLMRVLARRSLLLPLVGPALLAVHYATAVLALPWGVVLGLRWRRAERAAAAPERLAPAAAAVEFVGTFAAPVVPSSQQTITSMRSDNG